MFDSFAYGLQQEPVGPARSVQVRGLSATDLFGLASSAIVQGRPDDARTIFRALMSNPDRDIRLEAKFRLARLYIAEKQLKAAGILLREVVDENPDAQPARLELAGVLTRLGDVEAARRELRFARAGVLPPEVAQLVDRFSQSLRALKPYGGSIQFGLLADSNVNRATRSDSLGTVIGDFSLSDDARETSGRGVSIDGQLFGRIPLGRHQFTVTGSGSADLYRRGRFNDVSLGIKAGPDLSLKLGRLSLNGGYTRRWFGGERFTDVASAQATLSKALAPTAQGRVSLTAARIDNQRNRQEDGWSYSGGIEVEKALTQTTGVGLSVAAVRQHLRDPGYSTRSGQAALIGYRQWGRMTFTAAAIFGRLVADERLFLYPEKRDEWSRRFVLGVTARRIEFQGFSPTAQVTFERNKSSIEIYDYRRTAVEFGVTRAF